MTGHFFFARDSKASRPYPGFSFLLCACLALAVIACSPQTAAVAPAVTQASTPTLSASPSKPSSLSPTPSFTPTVTGTATPTITATWTPTITPTPTSTAWGGFPRNRLIAYADSQDVYTNNLDGSERRTVSADISHKGYKSTLGWSGDGQWIFFTEGMMCAGPCPTHLWAARSNALEVKLVYENTVDSATIAFRPNSGDFVFGCGFEPGVDFSSNKQLCLSNTQDFSVTPLGITGAKPAFSPDGQRLAWILSGKDSSRSISLFVQELGQGEPVQVTSFTSGITDRFLWLADNRTLVFIQRLNSVCEVYSVTVDGATPLLLQKFNACYGGQTEFVQASPDGRYVVFTYQASPYILDVTAPGTSVVARGMTYARVIWSPDGKLVAFKRGFPARWVDPQTGMSQEITADLPLYQLSLWLPNFYPFFNAVDWHVLALQP